MQYIETEIVLGYSALKINWSNVLPFLYKTKNKEATLLKQPENSMFRKNSFLQLDIVMCN